MGKQHRTVAVPHAVFIDDGGRWWRAKPGATSTFEENVAARALFIDLHHDQFWNPWRMEDQAAELERAEQVMEEWDRAEPGFKRKTKRQLDAEMARWDRDFERRQAGREERRQEGLRQYNPEREENRLALLERGSILAHKSNELAQVRSGEAFPAMDQQRRADMVAILEAEVAQHEAAVADLTPLVGDPEEVVDRNGRLPRDRRICTVYDFRERRIREVRKLRAQAAELEAQLKATNDRSVRAKIRSERRHAEWQLDKWLAIPRLEAEQMRADCATPEHGYGYVSRPTIGHAPPGRASAQSGPG